MTNSNFDWDAHVASSTFSDIRRQSPDLGVRRLPTLYSPDRSRLYLSSQDDDVATGEVKELLRVLPEIKAAYRRAINGPSINHGRAAVAEINFLEVCGLIGGLVEDPDTYQDPEALLLSR